MSEPELKGVEEGASRGCSTRMAQWNAHFVARCPDPPTPDPLPTPAPRSKSTLMDVLAGRKTGGVTSGEIHVNGWVGVEGLVWLSWRCSAGSWENWGRRRGPKARRFPLRRQPRFGIAAPAVIRPPTWCRIRLPTFLLCVRSFPKNQKTFARVMGYCEQEDVHLPQVGRLVQAPHGSPLAAAAALHALLTAAAPMPALRSLPMPRPLSRWLPASAAAALSHVLPPCPARPPPPSAGHRRRGAGFLRHPAPALHRLPGDSHRVY